MKPKTKNQQIQDLKNQVVELQCKIHDYERPDGCHCDTFRERKLREHNIKLQEDLVKVKECRDLLKDTIRSFNKVFNQSVNNNNLTRK